MRIQGTLTERDYITAQFLYLRTRRAILFMIVILFVALFLINDNWLIPVASTLFFVLLIAILIPFQARRAFRSYKALSEPIYIEVQEEGLYMKRTQGEGVLPWDHIYKWHYSPRMLLLQPGRNVTHILPRHFFDSDESYQAFVKLLRERTDGRE